MLTVQLVKSYFKWFGDAEHIENIWYITIYISANTKCNIV